MQPSRAEAIVIGAGKVGAVPGLFVNAGHEGAGIGLGPISAKLLVDRITGKAPALTLGPFGPNRFTRIDRENAHAG